MGTVNFTASTDEGSLTSNEEDEPPVEAIDLTHLVVTPPAPPARDPAPNPLIELDTIETPNKRRASLPTAEGLPEKRPCPSPQKPPNGEQYKCPVCFESVSQREPMSTKCGHVYCKECIQAAIRSYRKCPLCKKRLTLRNFHRIFL